MGRSLACDLRRALLRDCPTLLRERVLLGQGRMTTRSGDAVINHRRAWTSDLLSFGQRTWLAAVGAMLLFCSPPMPMAHAGRASASDLLPPRGLIPSGFVLDTSQTHVIGDALAEQTYVGSGGTSWVVSATVLPTSEGAWDSYFERQRALGQQDVVIEPLRGLGDEAITITDRAPHPLVVARTFAKAGRAALSVIETARPGTLDPSRRLRIMRWMVDHTRHLGG
jgi:hypothetical protein